jgi:hypothetical protein
MLEEKMKKTLAFISLMLMLGGCHWKGNSVTGSGTMKLEKRTVPAFVAVDISGAFDVEIVAQKEQSLEIEGDDNLLPLIRTEVKNGVLDISTDEGFSTKHKLRVRISVPNLDAINLSGASDIVASNIKSEDFKIDSSGASTIQISGETKTLDVEMSGASELDAREFIAQKVSVNSSGASNAEVYASEDLRVDSSGAGSVNYYGNPKNIVQDTSGAAKITKK